MLHRRARRCRARPRGGRRLRRRSGCRHRCRLQRERLTEQRPRVGSCGAPSAPRRQCPTRRCVRTRMTATRSATPATAPRSCVISTIAMPLLALELAASSARICAWMVTSSAVVGSSAISSSGLAGERDRDHDALAHAARELVRVLAHAPRRHRSPARARAAPARCRARLAPARAVGADDDLGNLLADAQVRRERGHRVLEHHADAARRARGRAPLAARPMSDSRPRTARCPSPGQSAAAGRGAARKSWLLPAPDSPTTPRHSPRPTVSVHVLGQRGPRRAASRR